MTKLNFIFKEEKMIILIIIGVLIAILLVIILFILIRHRSLALMLHFSGALQYRCRVMPNANVKRPLCTKSKFFSNSASNEEWQKPKRIRRSTVSSDLDSVYLNGRDVCSYSQSV